MFINVGDPNVPDDYHTVSFDPVYQNGSYPLADPMDSQGALQQGDWHRWSVTDGAVAYDDPGEFRT